MKKIFIVGLMSFIVPLFVVSSSFAAVNLLEKSCVGQPRTGVCADADTAGGRTNATSMIKNVINALIYLIAAIAVIMIAYSGFRYTTSAGDSNAVQNAKSVIIYSVVGLVVALAGYAVVNFVLDAIW